MRETVRPASDITVPDRSAAAFKEGCRRGRPRWRPFHLLVRLPFGRPIGKYLLTNRPLLFQHRYTNFKMVKTVARAPIPTTIMAPNRTVSRKASVSLLVRSSV